jgi:tetratricopeptide (TPR) repeat protein
MTRHNSNVNANIPRITAMGNNVRILRSFFLSLFVAIQFSATLLAGCATQHSVPGNPVTAKDHYLLGLRFYSQGADKDAIREFSMAIALDPNYTDAYRFRAETYSQTDFVAGMSDYADVIRLQPRAPGSYLSRAIAYNKLGDVERALMDLDVASSLEKSGPLSGNLHCTKADILFIDGRFPEALPEYRAYLAYLENLSVMPQIVVTLLTSGLLGMLDQIEMLKLQKQTIDVYREYANEKIQLCEGVVRRIGSHETPSAIVKGMSKQAILQSVLITDRIVGNNQVLVARQIEIGKNTYILDYPQPECQVTVTKTGPYEDRTIEVLIFMDNKLMSEKRVPLKDVSMLPEIPMTQTLINSGQPRAPVLEPWNFSIPKGGHIFFTRLSLPITNVAGKLGGGQSREQVHKTLRLTDKLIYEDDDFIVTFTEYLPAKDKRVRVTMLRDGKVLFSTYGSRPLW